MSQRIGFIGLGMMGSAMAARLISKGESLAVHTRTKGHAGQILSQGAHWCNYPAEVASKSNIVFSMLSTSDVLEAIALGPNGILGGLEAGSVHVDCSTVSPAVTESLSRKYAAQGRHFLHCPVLGSMPQASEGSLLLFAGGPEEAFRKTEPVLRHLGSRIWRFDTADKASQMKLLCNSFIAGMITTLAQAIAYSQKVNLSGETLLEIISHSALNAPMYQAKGKSMLEGNFNPRFFAELMLKDINLMVDAARSAGIRLPGLEAAQGLFTETVGKGFGKEDYSAVVKVL